MSKLLLDTNILIYAKDKSSQFHQKSKALFNSSFELHTTSKNLTEYYAVTTRGVSPLLTSEEALADLDEFSANFAVLFPNELSLTILKELIKVHSPKVYSFTILRLLQFLWQMILHGLQLLMWTILEILRELKL